MHREQKDKNFILMYAGSSRLMRNFVSSLLQASGYVLFDEASRFSCVKIGSEVAMRHRGRIS